MASRSKKPDRPSEVPAAKGQDDQHSAFLQWVKEQGVKIDGVEARELPGRGFGLLASRPLKKDEEILRVPVAAMVTVDSDMVKQAALPNARVHAQLAAALTFHVLRCQNIANFSKHDTNEKSDIDRDLMIWRATWPTQTDLKQDMPLFWSEELQSHLPTHTQTLLKKQQQKLEEQWQTYLTHPQAKPSHREIFTYIWAIVNSRCFFWERPNTRKLAAHKKRGNHKRARVEKKIDSEDCMALVPFADYFNHSSTGCTFDSDVTGCWIVCDRDYAEGEEVVVCYGKHDNDTLMIEYGFSFDDNEHDNVRLDDLFADIELWKGREAQRALLEERGYIGDYNLTRDGICFRTEVALRSLVCSAKVLEGFKDGEEDNANTVRKANCKLREMLKAYLVVIDSKTAELTTTINDSQTSANELAALRSILSRWQQINRLVAHVVGSLDSDHN